MRLSTLLCWGGADSMRKLGRNSAASLAMSVYGPTAAVPLPDRRHVAVEVAKLVQGNQGARSAG
jgi:hypothetical protein